MTFTTERKAELLARIARHEAADTIALPYDEAASWPRRFVEALPRTW
jgi:hypothetical protein